MTTNRIIKVYIADDHPIIRKGLVEIIQEQKNIECIGEGTNGKEAFEQICELEPEIAIIDIDMPVMSGLEVCEKAMSKSPLTRFVILTMHKEESYYKNAMNMGVFGYLNKDTILNDLLDCIYAVHKGDKYVSPLMRKFLDDGESKSVSDKWAKKYELTPSEINILKFVKQGKTNKEIAEILFVSEKAIEAHRTNCIKKFGIESGKNALMKFLLENKEI
jgi:DNA-binding NarL/FixJ family response regulator